jgi:hypothetical protein
VIAQVVLAELASIVAEIEQELGKRRGCRAADTMGCPENNAITRNVLIADRLLYLASGENLCSDPQRCICII